MKYPLSTEIFLVAANAQQFQDKKDNNKNYCKSLGYIQGASEYNDKFAKGNNDARELFTNEDDKLFFMDQENLRDPKHRYNKIRIRNYSSSSGEHQDQAEPITLTTSILEWVFSD